VPATLRHATWHGITFADTIFPSFVFAAGVAMALSAARVPAEGRHAATRRLLVRVALLFAIGIVTNVLFALAVGSPGLRIPGVLQRIALSSLLAWPFARGRVRTVLAAAAAFLLAHSLLLLVFTPAGVPLRLAAPGATAAAWLDRLLLGPGYGSGLDPENLLGTLSSAGGMLLGVAAGRVIVDRGDRQVWPVLAMGGAVALALGVAANPWLPVNKRLWTATFVLVVSGADALLLGALHEVVDQRGHRWLARPVLPLGRNALALFVGSELLAALLLWIRVPDGTSLYAALSQGLVDALGGPAGSVSFALANVALWWAVAIALDRRDIYIRL
jgi:predicted acyltransferase